MLSLNSRMFHVPGLAAPRFVLIAVRSTKGRNDSQRSERQTPRSILPLRRDDTDNIVAVELGLTGRSVPIPVDAGKSQRTSCAVGVPFAGLASGRAGCQVDSQVLTGGADYFAGDVLDRSGQIVATVVGLPEEDDYVCFGAGYLFASY